MTLSLLLLAADSRPPCVLPSSGFVSLFCMGGCVATTTAPMGRFVALTSHRGTNMRTNSGDPLATAAPGSNCCSRSPIAQLTTVSYHDATCFAGGAGALGLHHAALNFVHVDRSVMTSYVFTLTVAPVKGFFKDRVKESSTCSMQKTGSMTMHNKRLAFQCNDRHVEGDYSHWPDKDTSAAQYVLLNRRLPCHSSAMLPCQCHDQGRSLVARCQLWQHGTCQAASVCPALLLDVRSIPGSPAPAAALPSHIHLGKTADRWCGAYLLSRCALAHHSQQDHSASSACCCHPVAAHKI